MATPEVDRKRGYADPWQLIADLADLAPLARLEAIAQRLVSDIPGARYAACYRTEDVELVRLIDKAAHPHESHALAGLLSATVKRNSGLVTIFRRSEAAGARIALDDLGAWKNDPYPGTPHADLAALLTPLGTADRFKGVLLVLIDRPHSEDTWRQLHGLGGIATTALEQLQTEAELRQHTRHLAAFHLVTNGMRFDEAQNALLHKIAQAIAEAMNIAAVTISFIEDDTQDLVLQAHHGLAPEPQEMRQDPRANPTIWETLQHGALTVIDTCGDLLWPTACTLSTTEPHSVVMLPLTREQKPAGLLMVASQSTRHFQPLEIQLLRTAADRIINELGYAQATRERQQDRTARAFLRELAENLLPLQTAGDATACVLQTILAHFGWESGCGLLAREPDGQLIAIAQAGNAALAETLARRTIDTDIPTSAASQPVVFRQMTAAPATIIQIPIRYAQHVQGWLLVGHTQSKNISPQMLDALDAAGGYLGTTLENTRRCCNTAPTSEIIPVETRAAGTGDALWLRRTATVLRDPVTLLEGYADLLANGELGPLNTSQSQAARMIQEQARFLRRTTRDFTAWNQLQSRDLRMQPLAVESWLPPIIGSLRHHAEEHGLGLDCDIQPQIGTILGDPLLLQIAVENLLEAIIEATPPAQAVALNGVRTDVAIQIAIKLPETSTSYTLLIENLIPAVTPQETNVTPPPGLLLAREIITAHRGQIQVSNAGRPPTIAIVLPFEQ
ncbi:MAG: GAF domain-containing protein [Anaerolineae bacterium]|nr:GAF domain-containing protein [Anaerolineae bacterium]